MRQDRETIVVVAHPDDEVLWFSSVLPRADEVVLAFGPYAAVPGLAEQRDRAVADLPLPVTFLRLAEAGSYAMADWARPTESASGIELSRAPREIREAYDTNFIAVRDYLLDVLKPGQDVYSHNPWGEYGHEDHVLVFRAVEAARRRIGFRHWVPGYVSDRSAALARQWQGRMPRPSQPSPTDQDFAASIEAIYRRHNCWTWDPGWIWPKQEWFFRMDDAADPASGLGGAPLIEVVRA